jgi:hypothetical protein
MPAIKTNSPRLAASYLLSALLAFPTLVSAQEPPSPPASISESDAQPAPAPGGGWKRVGDLSAQNQPGPDYTAQQPPPAAGNGQPMPQPPPPPPGDSDGSSYQAPPPSYPAQRQQPQSSYPQPQAPQNYQSVPPVLTVPAGSFLTVRVNQMLSSDRNQPGDAFSASLVQPLVVNGVVVAEPGQTLGGRVTEAVKAGRVEGVSRLGVQLTDLTLVDGQQIPILSSLVNRAGSTSVGQDAATIAGTTGLGAAIGAAAAWGKGAAIGAGAGAAAGIIGVLVSRGHASVLYPEQILTFRVETPFTISTERASQAFRYVRPGEYDRPVYNQEPPQQRYGYYGGAAYPVPYYGYPRPYFGYGYGYPSYWGPSFSLFVGPRYYGGYGYYGGGPRYFGGGGYVRSGGYLRGGGGYARGGGSRGGHR